MSSNPIKSGGFMFFSNFLDQYFGLPYAVPPRNLGPKGHLLGLICRLVVLVLGLCLRRLLEETSLESDATGLVG
jgi:hypothetical protein